jgi:hypothetical protein
LALLHGVTSYHPSSLVIILMAVLLKHHNAKRRKELAVEKNAFSIQS